MPAIKVLQDNALSPWQLRRLRNRLRRSTCSETWIDDQIVVRRFIDSDGDEIQQWVHDPRVFPPGGRRDTKMRWCRCCGRDTPRPAVQLIEYRLARHGPVVAATLQCDDCRISIDQELHAELYAAGLHLQPAGSKSVVSRHALNQDRRRPQ